MPDEARNIKVVAVTRRFTWDKETRNMVRFAEETAAGSVPISNYYYLSKAAWRSLGHPRVISLTVRGVEFVPGVTR